MPSLSASKRTTMLKQIGERLQVEEWPLIDVTLVQFGLPKSDTWQGDKYAYVLQMCTEAPDHTLIELAQHVGYLVEETLKPGIDPPFWRKRMFRLFISHLSTGKAYAAELQEALLNFGICGFVAHNDIEPTLEWQSQIETALSTADSLVALLQPDFHKSHWTDQEIGFAMGRGLPVFAVRFGQDPYGFIGRFQAFTGSGKSADELGRELFDSYRKNKQTMKRMGEVLVNLFEDSRNFASAKVRIAYLEGLEEWDSSFIPRLDAASKSNPQISGSFGVPQRVQKLCEKWKEM